MLNNKQIKTVQVVMVFFIVSTVMCVAYIIYSHSKQKIDNDEREYYKDLSNTYINSRDSLLKAAQTNDTLYIVPTDTLAKMKYYSNPLPDSLETLVREGKVRKVKVQ
ncbi:MAG: hypothetical protein SGJ10_03580 [Bacteroidota bacterium]|nr:hypothetical protein [Bacteroidota bacterium]